MQTTQVQCKLEVKGVLQETFPLLSDCGRFVLNMKKWKYTTSITSHIVMLHFFAVKYSSRPLLLLDVLECLCSSIFMRSRR
jgi:hypothetical protein